MVNLSELFISDVKGCYNAEENKKEYLSVLELKNRGWTDGLIKGYLGEPDLLKQNPYYKSSAPMRLYKTSRIEEIENTEGWKNTFEIVKKRKESAAKAVQTKRKKLLEYLETVEITVPELPYNDLVKKACKHYNKLQLSRGNYNFFHATPKSEEYFLLRITVNYLRHALSEYEDKLEEVFGKVGVKDAYFDINLKVHKAISDVYPQLKEECERQLYVKFGEDEEDF